MKPFNISYTCHKFYFIYRIDINNNNDNKKKWKNVLVTLNNLKRQKEEKKNVRSLQFGKFLIINTFMSTFKLAYLNA